jgi:alpha-mannosidase
MLKVAFPLAIEQNVATFEIPYGTIQRSTVPANSMEEAKFEVPALRWADLSDTDYGVSFLNASKYGYDAEGNVLRLSLLRSPRWPDPTADRGSHSIRYSLYPHAGGWQEAGTVQRGYELNAPLLATLAARQDGKLPLRHSFVELSPAPLILTSIKMAEESNSWILQWYNTQDAPVQATLQLPHRPTRVYISDFLEKEITPLTVDGTAVVLETEPHAVVTLKAYFD